MESLKDRFRLRQKFTCLPDDDRNFFIGDYGLKAVICLKPPIECVQEKAVELGIDSARFREMLSEKRVDTRMFPRFEIAFRQEGGSRIEHGVIDAARSNVCLVPL